MAYKVARRSLCSIALGLPCRNRPAEFARTSLSACGLPTPIVALACIGNVDIQVLSCADGEPYFLRRLQSGGGVYPRSITSRAAVSKPSGGIRSLLSLSACGLPTPIVALACIGNVDIQVFSSING